MGEAPPHPANLVHILHMRENNIYCMAVYTGGLELCTWSLGPNARLGHYAVQELRVLCDFRDFRSESGGSRLHIHLFPQTGTLRGFLIPSGSHCILH